MKGKEKGMNQEAYEDTLTEEEVNEYVDYLQDKNWTDDELELLGTLGQDPLALEKEEHSGNTVSDAELTEWSEDVDVLDTDTETYNEG